MRKRNELHAESLLRHPLVREMLEDRSIKFVPRALDSDWVYEKTLPSSVSGFNPSRGEVYYNRNSQFAKWIADPSVSARSLNVRDFLINEVHFAIHDYLHIWAYQAINQLEPGLNFGNTEVSADQIETMAFCHLLTEAVATIGLDYWFLTQHNINEIVPIGTNSPSLTVTYRKSCDTELQRFGIQLEVFNESFFSVLANFYMSGEFDNIPVKALEQSPLLLHWFTHELEYGETQRVYTRQWLRNLAGFSRDDLSRKVLSLPVSVNQDWQRRLIKNIGKLLWEKVVLQKQIRFKSMKLRGWKANPGADIFDFRFQNLNSFGPSFWKKIKDCPVHPASRTYLFAQIVSKFEFEKLDPSLIRILKRFEHGFDIRDLEYLLKDAKMLKATREPKDIFFLG